MTFTDIEKKRFWDKVIIKYGDDCWLYQGHLTKGYGRIKIRNKLELAHRISWIIHYGSIPIGKLILHKCDIRNCVNPKHLYLGSYSDNMSDRQARNSGTIKGRPLSLPTHIIEELKVLHFTKHISYRDLSSKFNIPSTTIWRSVKNER